MPDWEIQVCLADPIISRTQRAELFLITRSLKTHTELDSESKPSDDLKSRLPDRGLPQVLGAQLHSTRHDINTPLVPTRSMCSAIYLPGLRDLSTCLLRVDQVTGASMRSDRL